MKRKVLFRGLLGAPLGLAISTMITIIISLCVGDGRFYPVVPELTSSCGTELNAVLLQTACSLLYGASWGSASVIWEQERWSLLRQSGTHLLVVSLTSLPIAYVTYWMEHSVSGILIYFGTFFGIYLIIWLIQYGAVRRRVREMNESVRRQKERDGH